MIPIDWPIYLSDWRINSCLASGGRQSKQSSSRSKLSSNSSNNNENPLLKSFKNFRRKSDPKNEQPQTIQSNTEVNSILYRRPSINVTSSINDLENGGFLPESGKSLKPPDTINLTPPSPAPSANSFLKAPTHFLKVKYCYAQNKMPICLCMKRNGIIMV